jgi:hypothetical protein
MGDRPYRISITEMLEFMRCERAWDLESANRRSLVRKGIPATALWMGSAFHAAMADLGDPIGTLRAYVQEQRIEMATSYVAQVGVAVSAEEWTAFDESAKLIEAVVVEYLRHYGLQPFKPYEVLANEMTFSLTLENGVELVGTIDKVLLDPIGKLWVCDHKTWSQRPDVRDLQYDFQFTGYCACLQALVREPVTGFLYDGVNKKIPRKPRILQDGHVSLEWIDTSSAVYCQAVRDNGEDPTSLRYSGFVARLRERDENNSPFFLRHPLYISQAQITQWWENVYTVVEQMMAVKKPTFNRRWEGCWDCNVRDICDTMLRGDDVDWVIDTNYHIGTYGTQRKLAKVVSPTNVYSIDSLRSTLAG